MGMHAQSEGPNQTKGPRLNDGQAVHLFTVSAGGYVLYYSLGHQVVRKVL